VEHGEWRTPKPAWFKRAAAREFIFVEDGFEMWSCDVVAFNFPKYHFCIAAVELMNGQLAFQPMQVHRYRRCTPLVTPQYIAVKPSGLDNIIVQYREVHWRGVATLSSGFR
jgi:hypothetical protein